MIDKFNKITRTFVVESSPTHSYSKFQTDIEKSKNFEEECRGVSGSPESVGQVSPGLQSSGLKCTGLQSPCLKCAGLQGSNTGKNGALGLLRFNPGVHSGRISSDKPKKSSDPELHSKSFGAPNTSTPALSGTLMGRRNL